MTDELSQSIPQALSHVFWIGGPGCSGKSSVAKLLGSEFNLRVYHVDNEIQKQEPHPDLRLVRQFGCDLWSWLGTALLELPPQEIATTIINEWRGGVFAQTVTHLLTLPRNKRIIVEGLFLPESLLTVAPRDHIAMLYANRTFREKYFADRYSWFEPYTNQAAAIDTALDALDAMDRQWTAQATQWNVLALPIQAPPDIGTVSAQVATHFMLV